MASDAKPQELVATLFHRPLPAVPSTSSSSLSSTTVDAFITTLKSIHETNEDIPYTYRALDSPTHSHILSIMFTPALSLSALRNHAAFAKFENAYSLELHLQSSHTFKTTKRLAVFDMDSTLIQQEVIDLLAAHAGVEAQVSSITSRAMNGELDFSASLRERVALLKGLPVDVFNSLKSQITLMPGAETLVTCLKKMNVKTALLSGGFTPLARYIGARLGIDHIHANELNVDLATSMLTGELSPSSIIVDAARKRFLLKTIASDLHITDASEIIAVGDGANDLLMMEAAGLGVAVNAKPRVQRLAPGRLNGATALLDVLYLLGLTADKIDELAD